MRNNLKEENNNINRKAEVGGKVPLNINRNKTDWTNIFRFPLK